MATSVGSYTQGFAAARAVLGTSVAQWGAASSETALPDLVIAEHPDKYMKLDIFGYEVHRYMPSNYHGITTYLPISPESLPDNGLSLTT